MNNKPFSIPFRVGGPIQDPQNFVGRTDVIEKMSKAMFNLQNVSLHGERRTGKTSVLLYLSHPSTLSVLGLPESHVPVYFNFQDFSRAKIKIVWTAIGDAIAEKIERSRPKRKSDAQQFLRILSEFTTSKRGSELLGTGFGRALTYLEDRGLKIHLLFDEFDQTARNPNLGDPFYDALRSLPTRTENVSYIIATRAGLAALQPEYTKVSSPFFNIFSSITLGPLEEQEVVELIFGYFSRSGLNISLAEKLCNELEFLFEVTGYHPFFVQTLCYHLSLNLSNPKWPLGSARNKALKAFYKDSQPHFNFYWQVSTIDEQVLMKKLARNEQSDLGSNEVKPILERLRDRCLIVYDASSANKWRLFSNGFDDWIKLNSSRYRRTQETKGMSGRFSYLVLLFFTLLVILFIANLYRSKNQSSGIASKITIQTTPERAAVFLNADSIGLTPIQNFSIQLGQYDLLIEKNEYETINQLITFEGDTSLFFDLLAKEGPKAISDTLVSTDVVSSDSSKTSSMRRLRVSSSPQGAAIMLNGEKMGHTPADIKVRQGVHRIRLTKDTFAVYDTTVSVNNVRVSSVYAILAPLKGVLVFLVKPYGSIYVDNQLMVKNSSKQFTTDLSPGLHKLKVTHPDLGNWEKTINIEPGRLKVFPIDFTRWVKVRVIAFDIDNNPIQNGEIYVDGKSTGRFTPSRLTLRIGLHTIEVRHSDYVATAKEKPMNLEEDRKEPLKFILKPIN